VSPDVREPKSLASKVELLLADCVPVPVLKRRGVDADSGNDSRLGTDGNQPRLELREGAADDAALLIAQEQIRRMANLLAQRSKTLASLDRC
jgi:hypothetical protein